MERKKSMLDHTTERLSKTIGGVTTVYPNDAYNRTGATTTIHITDPSGIELATIEGNGLSTTTVYSHQDHLGSTNVLTTNIGTLKEVSDYYPYGAPRVQTTYTGTSEQRKYLSEDYDADSNLSYLNARFLDSARGQFLTQDPVFWEVGQTSDGRAVLLNPQAQNSYSYAGNNPITQKDPTGRFWWSEFYTDWNGYDVTSMSMDNGLILKAGEVLGGRSAALAAIEANAGNIAAASQQTGMSPEMIKAIIYEEQSHQFPPFGGETLIENVAPGRINGGIGVMQVSSKTSGLKNKDLLNSKTNITAGATILKDIQNGGNSSVSSVASKYNSEFGGAHADRYGNRVSSYSSNSTYTSNMSRLLSQLSSALKKLSTALKKK